MIAPANARPNESPNEPAAELTPAASLDALLGDRGQRVVVELGDEQAEAGAGDRSAASARSQPESARGTIGISTSTPTARAAAKPTRTIAAGPARRPRVRPASSATANMLSDSGASERPGLHRVVLEHDLEVDRQRDHRAAERDLLEHLLRDPDPERSRVEQARRRAAPACRSRLRRPQPVRERRQRDARRARSARRRPRRPPARRGCRARRRPCRPPTAAEPTTSTPRGAGVGHVAHEPDPRQHDRDHDHLEPRTRPATRGRS